MSRIVVEKLYKYLEQQVPMNVVEDSLSETRGEGMGVGNPAQRDGGAAYCVCQGCGAVYDHTPGVPCTQSACEKCGSALVGADKAEVDSLQSEAKAKAKSRGACILPAEHAKVTDDKDHYPINSAAQARNALSRVGQHDSSPKWYNGSLASLQKMVKNAVKKAYPSIEVAESADAEVQKETCALKNVDKEDSKKKVDKKANKKVDKDKKEEGMATYQCLACGKVFEAWKRATIICVECRVAGAELVYEEAEIEGEMTPEEVKQDTIAAVKSIGKHTNELLARDLLKKFTHWDFWKDPALVTVSIPTADKIVSELLDYLQTSATEEDIDSVYNHIHRFLKNPETNEEKLIASNIVESNLPSWMTQAVENYLTEVENAPEDFGEADVDSVIDFVVSVNPNQLEELTDETTAELTAFIKAYGIVDAPEVDEAFKPGEKFDLDDKKYKVLDIVGSGKTVVAINTDTEEVKKISLASISKADEALESAKLNEAAGDRFEANLKTSLTVDGESTSSIKLETRNIPVSYTIEIDYKSWGIESIYFNFDKPITVEWSDSKGEHSTEVDLSDANILWQKGSQYSLGDMVISMDSEHDAADITIYAFYLVPIGA